MATVGYPMSENAPDLKGAVVLIVSHSGQTFAPLACSSLLQSFTQDIFLVTSEWDTQIGKQLRILLASQMKAGVDSIQSKANAFSSRIFVTDVGVRPAEPCSVSVVALHQLLTQIFLHVSISLLSEPEIRSFCGAAITEADLSILERCNQESIKALEDLVATDRKGRVRRDGTRIHNELRQAGDVWSEHVLENARAYIFTFLYVVGTVTAGYPLVTGIAVAAGLDVGWAFYICRFLDGLLYFFFHQLTVFVIRLVQGRRLRQRTSGRTVVIGDCPWVAQSADAFLSKIFATTFPVASINVLHGNPADHLVHRHTHRVARGTLLVCGRPDGRLTALTNTEVSVCLSVSQASSIQNIGGTCESITIGHHPSDLGLTSNDIYLETNRPRFLCEQVVANLDIESGRDEIPSKFDLSESETARSWHSNHSDTLSDTSSRGRQHRRSLLEVKGLYATLQQVAELKEMDDNATVVTFATKQLEQEVVGQMLSEKQGLQQLRRVFNEMDTRKVGLVSVDTFVASYRLAKGGLGEDQVRQILREVGVGLRDGLMNFDDFCRVSSLPEVEVIRKLQISAPRDHRGLVVVEPSREEYFGQAMQASSSVASMDAFSLAQSQHFAMELYESRVASMERYVAMCVLFHQMGRRVQDFFPRWSMGLLRYRMDRTHSIMRIATTASPVSGADVRERLEALRVRAKIQNSVRVIESAWCRYQQYQLHRWKAERASTALTASTRTTDSNVTNETTMDDEHPPASMESIPSSRSPALQSRKKRSTVARMPSRARLVVVQSKQQQQQQQQQRSQATPSLLLQRTPSAGLVSQLNKKPSGSAPPPRPQPPTHTKTPLSLVSLLNNNQSLSYQTGPSTTKTTTNGPPLARKGSLGAPIKRPGKRIPSRVANAIP